MVLTALQLPIIHYHPDWQKLFAYCIKEKIHGVQMYKKQTSKQTKQTNIVLLWTGKFTGNFS